MESMGTEELLKPRYRVIADYPSSDYKVGDLIENIGPNYCEFLSRYPHLFKKLEWWEERDVKDMPKYVKNLADGRVDKLEKVVPHEKYPFKITAQVFLEGGIYEYIENKRAMPATEKEYQDYKSKQK